jgi:putative Mg2+ transporter-C (MgtC) family protein
MSAGWYKTGVTLPLGELLLRLGVTMVLCGLVGLERESRDQVAGLRTHILVGLGSALFTIVSAYGFEGLIGTGPPPGVRIQLDPTRIAAQIVSGIGFLGAGAIIRQGFNVRGLTTAAALWIVAAIGMAAGAGYYEGAVATTALALPALILFRRVRPLLMSRLRTGYVLIDLDLRPEGSLVDALALLAHAGHNIQGPTSDVSDDQASFRLEVRVPPDRELEPVLAELSRMEGVARVNAVGMNP